MGNPENLSPNTKFVPMKNTVNNAKVYYLTQVKELLLSGGSNDTVKMVMKMTTTMVMKLVMRMRTAMTMRITMKMTIRVTRREQQ